MYRGPCTYKADLVRTRQRGPDHVWLPREGSTPDGRDQAHAPSYQFFVGADYQIGEDYFVSAQLEGKDAFFFSNSHNTKSEAHELLHLAAGYRGDQFDVTVWGRNLFDKDYEVRGFYFPNNPLNGWIVESYTQLGEPRTFGVTAEYHF